MNSLIQVTHIGSAVSKRSMLQRLIKIGYLTAIGAAMIGWMSAFGWITVRLAKWLLT